MNQRWPLIVAAALLSLFVAQGHAADGLYIGAGIGQAGIKDNINTDTFDANDAAYKAFIGWRFKVPILDLAIEGAGSPDKVQFMEIARRDGLKAALAWRDARFTGPA